MIYKYKILHDLVLGFMTPREQFDAVVKVKDCQYLEFDGSTIWVIKNNERIESITSPNAIEIFEQNGWISKQEE